MRRFFSSVCICVLLTALIPSLALANETGGWVTTFTSAMAFQSGTLNDASIRDVVEIPISGSQIKFSISNQYGSIPLQIGQATVSEQLEGARPVVGTIETATFNGQNSVTIAPGQSVVSDPVAFNTFAFEHLLISLWIPNFADISAHSCCEGTINTYATPDFSGNQAASGNSSSYSLVNYQNEFVNAVFIYASEKYNTVAVFGDSISDESNGWVSMLNLRLLGSSSPKKYNVINESIIGNTLLSLPGDLENQGGGAPATLRIKSTLAGISGIKYVILELGGNDILFGANFTQITGAISQINSYLKSIGVQLIVMTIIPRQISGRWTQSDENLRLQINTWIKENINDYFDAAQILADIYNGNCNTSTLFPAFNAGDALTLTYIGDLYLANSINTPVLSNAPVIPYPTTQHVTPNCIKNANFPGTYPASSVPTTVGKTSSEPAKLNKVEATVSGGGILILILLVTFWYISRRRSQIKERQFYKSLGSRKF
jgi:lysophospholipase L1-like esterase